MEVLQIEMMAHPEGSLLTMVVNERPQNISETITNAKQGGYEIDITPKKQKRSLDANGLYWSILTKLSNALDAPVPFMHNQMLRRYGQPAIIGGQLMFAVIPDTEAAEQEIDNSETMHLRPTSQVRVGKDGSKLRTYVILRGSSTYDKKEFSSLIDGLLSECKEVGIDIISKRDLDMIKEYNTWKSGVKSKA